MSLSKRSQEIIYWIKNKSFEDYLKHYEYGEYGIDPNYIIPVNMKLSILTETLDDIIKNYEFGGMASEIFHNFEMFQFIDAKDDKETDFFETFYKAIISFIRVEFSVRYNNEYVNGFTNDMETFAYE